MTSSNFLFISVSYLVDTVSECIRDPSHDGPPHLRGRHLPQLDGRGLAVEGRVGRHDQVGRVLQGRVA